MPAAFAGALREREKHLRPADLLGEERDRPRAVVVEHKCQMIFDPEHGFVAGRHLVGYRDAARHESARDVGHRCAALRYHGCRRAAARCRVRRQRWPERIGDAVDEVRQAQTVGAVHRHAAARGDLNDALLIAPSRFVLLGKAGREHHRTAHAEGGQRFERLDDAGARHAQHRRIDAGRQFLNRAYAAPLADGIPVAADQMQLARKAEAVEVADLGFTERAGFFRDADDCDGTRPQQTFEPGAGRDVSHPGDTHRVRAGTTSHRGTARGP